LFGAVIGAYRPETDDFVYDVIDVKYFQRPLFEKKLYLDEAGRIALRLAERLKPEEDEVFELCRGDILNVAAEALIEAFGEERIVRVKVEGRAQHLVEETYLSEIRNLGYEPLPDRTEKWAKSFWHMYRWLRDNPRMLKHAKTGMPRLQRFKLFR
jgi:hypothetical protein